MQTVASIYKNRKIHALLEHTQIITTTLERNLAIANMGKYITTRARIL